MRYILKGMAVLLVFLFISFMVVFHTQMGSRWTINFLIKDLPIQIDKIQGTLADEINVYGFTYADESLRIKSSQLSYKIQDIHWFSKQLIVDKVDIQKLQVEILSSDRAKETHANSEFSGITLPLSIDIKSLKVDGLSVSSKQTTEEFKQLTLSVNAENQDLNISNLSIEHKNFLVNNSGLLQLKAHLPFDLKQQWRLFDNDNSVSGTGEITGNLTGIDLHQKILLEKGLMSGGLDFQSSIDLSQEIPRIKAALTSQKMALNLENQAPVQIQSLGIEVTGALDSYQLQSTFQVSNEKFKEAVVSLQGQGNLDSLNLDNVSIKNAQNTIELATQLSWQDELTAATQIVIKQLNPAVVFPQWPGLVKGTANLKATIFEKGAYALTLDQAEFKGQLKGLDFSISAVVGIKPDEILVQESQLLLGNNKIDINGTLKNNIINADLIAKLNDLSVFDKNTKGTVDSNISLKGAFNNPKIVGQLSANDLAYNDYQITSLDVNVGGDLLKDMTIKTLAKGVKSEGYLLDEIKLDINGSKSKHNIIAHIEDAFITSELSAIGSWNDDKKQWFGQILKHNLIMKDNQDQWALEQPVTIEYQKDFKVSKACWTNKTTIGDVCLNFSIDTSKNSYQADINLNQLQTKTLEVFFPKDFNVDGMLQGNAAIQLNNDKVYFDAKIDLTDGKLSVLKNSEQGYQAKILKATLQASQNKQSSKVNAELSLDDGTNLTVNFDLFKAHAGQLAVNGKVEGVFANTQYLASLTEEIEEMKGDFNIDGLITGTLSQPKFSFHAKQIQGYLLLSQTKTKVKNIVLEAQQEPGQAIVFNMGGLAGEGKFTANGQLNIDKDNRWQLKAQVIGDSMRLLTLPELELDITPNLVIEANEKIMKITGVVNIPYAQVLIKQLPPSAVVSSPDIVVHKSSDEIEQSNEYLINYDVQAHIDKFIKIDILGLKAEVNGNLRVNNLENSITNGYGSLKLNNGKYKIYGQALDISKGELLFNGPIDNPNLNVKASRKSISGDVVAGVELGGSINSLQSSLYSDPALSELEILSYILSGRGLNEESNTSSTQLAQAAILLGLNKSSPIFAEIQSKLGIDVLTIKEGATTKDSQVEAGKQLNEKLYVGYNQGLFNRVGFLVLRYRINKALRLETTQGDSQSVDLIYVKKKK